MLEILKNGSFIINDYRGIRSCYSKRIERQNDHFLLEKALTKQKESGSISTQNLKNSWQWSI